ncbi:dynein axonemal assembly factor 4 [Andrena cerasifolii]|uniref:dynein axonemal assembly factor 4 n=1 Tax=Andrena cerasifolii TaxID=2819439 RepID=UPI0040384D81
MPAIVIKDYTWRQTSEFVILNVPLKGHPKKLDFFLIDDYMKVSFPPFILELFLWANVVENESNCVVSDREAILSLRKTDIDLKWPTLEVQSIDNELKREYRNRALERAQTVAEERAKIQSDKRQRLQKEAVNEQISITTATLNKIDAIRNSHRKEAMREFDDWRSKAELPFLPSIEGEIQENRKAYKQPLKWFKDTDDKLKSRLLTDDEILGGSASAKEHPPSELKELEHNVSEESREVSTETKKVEEEKSFLASTDDSSCSEDSEADYKSKSRSFVTEMKGDELRKFCEKKKKARPGLASVRAAINGKLVKSNSIFEEPSKPVPLPREAGVINIKFSERKFPTPARESSHLEEQEWLQKQAEARRKIGFDADDLRPEERDPQWLKDKGDEFYKVGNYLGAISAYSYGVKISDKMASLYVNRSAAHYALGNYHKCMEDCSKALELMEPKCEGNRESRARCHARRGAALCKVSAPQHGIPELQAALELTPDNESIKRDLLTAKQYFGMKD